MDTPLTPRAALDACPLCGHAAFHPTGPACAGFTVRNGARPFLQPPYAVRDCLHCGLLYKDTVAPLSELTAYYATADWRKWDTAGLFPTERAALRLLTQLPSGSRVLDFGCGSGRLLARLLPRYDCWAFEPNPAAAAHASTRGLKMLPAGFLEASSPPAPAPRFDAITLLDVFEHLPCPATTIHRLLQILNPSGLLLIVTGCGDHPVCRLDPAQFWYFRNFEHLCMLTRRTVDFLTTHLRAELMHWELVSHYDSAFASRLPKTVQHFCYWQFQRRTAFSKAFLAWVPLLNRARHWAVAPAYDLGNDHAVILLRKP